MKNVNKKLIEYNKKKHQLILNKINNKVSRSYFVRQDYTYLSKLDPLIAGAVWHKLVKNIMVYGFYGISRETCVFCLLIDMANLDCNSCVWGKHHNKCGVDEESSFNKLQKIFKEDKIQTITSKEYKNIIREMSKEMGL